MLFYLWKRTNRKYMTIFITNLKEKVVIYFLFVYSDFNKNKIKLYNYKLKSYNYKINIDKNKYIC